MKNKLFKKVVAVMLVAVMTVGMSAMVFAVSLSTECSTLISNGYDIEDNSGSISVDGEEFNYNEKQGEGFTRKYSITTTNGDNRTYYFESNEIEKKIKNIANEIKEKEDSGAGSVNEILGQAKGELKKVTSTMKTDINLNEVEERTPFLKSWRQTALNYIVWIGWSIYLVIIVFNGVLVCLPFARKCCLQETGEKKEEGFGGFLAIFVQDSTLDAIEETKNPSADGKRRSKIAIFMEKEFVVIVWFIVATLLLPCGLIFTIADAVVDAWTTFFK